MTDDYRCKCGHLWSIHRPDRHEGGKVACHVLIKVERGHFDVCACPMFRVAALAGHQG